ncbi:MAG: aldehyde dehydrogenase family protein [Actinomycetota bacterium]
MQRATELWIGGQWVAADGGATFEDLNPLDDAVFATAADASPGDVERAVEAATASAPDYARTLPKEREAWLQRAAALLEERRSVIIDLLIDEIGSPVGKANFEFNKSLDMMRAAAGMSRQMTGATIPSDMPNRWSLSVRQPLGVVAAITPFNVPLIKGVRLTAHPLALGNTVVWLPSEHAPVLATTLAEIYHDAGLPAGALNVVTGDGYRIGDTLTGHPDVAMVTFTGSSAVGQHINEVCAARKARVTLELGGKSALVVMDDADLSKAVAAACHGIFTFQGQVCMGTSRIYVHRQVYDEFLAAFAAAAGQLGGGDLRDPTTVIGPIISERQRERVREHIDQAVGAGATVVTGGDWEGHRCRPTVLTGVTEDMTLCAAETFGPVVAVYPVDSYDEALKRTNDSDYGLSSAIFTRDLDRALDFARNVNAGMCHVNASALHDEPHVPFGGNGQSGVGREGTEADIEAMTEWKWITIQV